MPITQPIAKCFGDGHPGWLVRDVPPMTAFDLALGRATGPAGTFVRSSATWQWARAG